MSFPVCQNILRCILLSNVLEVKDIINCLFVCKQFLISSMHLDFWLKLCKRYNYFDTYLKKESLDWTILRKMFLCFYKNLNIDAPLMKDIYERKEFRISEKLYMTLFMFDVSFVPFNRSIYPDFDDLILFEHLKKRIKDNFKKECPFISFLGINFFITNETLCIDNGGMFIDNNIMVPFFRRKRVKIVLQLYKDFVDNNNLVLSWRVLKIVEM